MRITLPLLLILFILGFAARYSVLSKQFELLGNDVPFSLESALQYRLTESVFQGKGIPAVDTMVQFPEGISSWKTYSIGAEYLYSWLAHLMPDEWPLSYRIRIAALLLFCLGIPALGLYTLRLTGSQLAGLTAAAFYAIAPSSVVRSYGLELSRENLGIPFALIFLMADMYARTVTRISARRIWSLISAVAGALSVVFWDLAQFLLGIWAIFRVLEDLRLAPNQRTHFYLPLVQTVAFALAGIAHPYLLSHRFLVGPLLWFMAGWTFWAAWRPVGQLSKTWGAAIPFIAALAASATGYLTGPGYGHFSEVLKAKIRFLNIKPDDPALLSYEARILWTPALHSATWDLAFQLFPCLLLLALAGFVLVCREKNAISRPLPWLPIAGFVISLFTFVLFARFHVFLSLFACIGGGLLAAWGTHRGDSRFYATAAILLIAWTVEAAGTLQNSAKWGRFANPDIGKQAYTFEKQLVDWFRENGQGTPVLAEFGISGPILAYGHCPIILHPKFEDATIRERVRTFAEIMFTSDERTLRDWMGQLGAGYVVFSPGEFYPHRINEQLRYMVNAVEENRESVAWKFNMQIHDSFHADVLGQPRKLSANYLRYFQCVWTNGKYGIFQPLSQDDESMALNFLNLAISAFDRGDIARARRNVVLALQYDPRSNAAYSLLARLEQLEAASPP